MKNRIILLTFFVLLFWGAKAQSAAESVVRSFGDNMLSWTQTGYLIYHKNLIRLSNGEKKVRVYDELSSYLFNKYNYDEANELDSYLNCLEKEMSAGITVRYSNFRKVSNDALTVYDANGLEFIACDINVTGTINRTFKDLFYIRKGKISKIDKYETVEDKETGKRKVRVDLSDLAYDNYETIGLTYNYSKHFPIGGSIYYAWESVPILLSFDFGYSNENTEYIIDKVDMTDIMNYKRVKKTLDPKYYMTITPHAYFKYFAVGCGFGALIMEGKEETAEYHYTSSSNGSGSIGNGWETNCSVSKFMIRPTVKGFIPLDDDDIWSIVVSAGYDCVFGYKDKNGFNVGLGVKVNLDW